MAKNVIKAWLADNTVTTDDKNDKIFIVETGQTYDLDDIVDLLHQQESGLRQETLMLSEISDNKSYPNQNIIPT